ncbi:hypothetical protein F5Y10DRAFT_260174 [Nemania abortiva]|nr:hypothetical protein F5Y10DRAFT_260174 [Nemania abortiva]
MTTFKVPNTPKPRNVNFGPNSFIPRPKPNAQSSKNIPTNPVWHTDLGITSPSSDTQDSQNTTTFGATPPLSTPSRPKSIHRTSSRTKPSRVTKNRGRSSNGVSIGRFDFKRRTREVSESESEYERQPGPLPHTCEIVQQNSEIFFDAGNGINPWVTLYGIPIPNGPFRVYPRNRRFWTRLLWGLWKYLQILGVGAVERLVSDFLMNRARHGWNKYYLEQDVVKEVDHPARETYF